MTSNPIQRKTRNAFLLGMVIMLIVSFAVVALLYLTLFKNTVKDSIEKGEKGTTLAYKLISPIKSGDQIENSKIELVELYVDDLPGDFVSDPTVTDYRSKLDLQAGTILSKSLIYKDKDVAASTRLMEYNMLTLPSTLKIGDYVDIRLTMPSGQDYIVLSKKQIMNIQNTTITLYLTEDEILMMSSAIIESYAMRASDLHVVQYVEAGTQKAATPTYSVNGDVYKLIISNSQKGINIEDYAKINESYNTELRSSIEQELTQYAGEKQGNIESGLTKQKEEAMSLYLSGLSGY